MLGKCFSVSHVTDMVMMSNSDFVMTKCVAVCTHEL